HAVDEAGSAEPVEADAQIRLLHDQQRGVAAADGQEIGAAEEHGVVHAFGGPGANNNDARRSRPDVIMLVGWALTVVALLGVGAIAIAPMHLVDAIRRGASA